MKRNQNLITLSWEHHDGLVSAFRLKRGLANKTDVQELIRFLIFVWSEDLVHHFDQEETVLAPPLEEIAGSSEILETFFNQHRRLAELAQSLQKTQINKRENIAEFIEMLEKHIRFEEREFYPFVEEHLSDEQLKKIGEYLHSQHRPACKTWEPEFWNTEKSKNK